MARKVLTFLKSNLAFFIIAGISLIFYFIAIFGGDYQTTTFFGVVKHYKFVTGVQDGVNLALIFVILPIICLVAVGVLYFLRPKKRDGVSATVFVAIFIGVATLAGALLVLIPFALFKDASVKYMQIADWKASAADVYYIKTYNFPLVSMVICLLSTIVLGCYASSTLSE